MGAAVVAITVLTAGIGTVIGGTTFGSAALATVVNTALASVASERRSTDASRALRRRGLSRPERSPGRMDLGVAGGAVRLDSEPPGHGDLPS